MGVIKNLLDLIFPPKCVFCGKFLHDEGGGICRRCQATLPFTEGAGVSRNGEFFDVCVSPLYYKDNVRKSILHFKFKGATGNAAAYASILADCIREQLTGKYDLISWVPISARREKTRGYDQAMLLALATALELGDVAVETLKKTTDIPAQSSLNGAEKRRANVSGVYTVADPELITGKHVLLIDDIITTGATLGECARTLLMAGAESVVCAALARA
ncbi:MAG: ComF family protein [Oscillospiraceae bacterium]